MGAMRPDLRCLFNGIQSIALQMIRSHGHYSLHSERLRMRGLPASARCLF